MNRPSHWLLAFFVALGGILWSSGALEGYFTEKTPSPTASRPAPSPVVVRRQPSAAPKPVVGELRGRVIDRLGWPVIAAEVAVIGTDGEPEPEATARTDADGRFALTIAAPASRRLRIAAGGRHQTRFVAGSLDDLVVIMQDPVPWAESGEAPGEAQPIGLLVGEGYLKDAEGRHVAGGRVTVIETGASVRADDTGRFSIPLPVGESTLVAFDDEGGIAVSDPLRHARTQGKVPVADLTLAPGLRLSGFLKDADGEPCQGAPLEVENGGIRRWTVCGTGGFFDFRGLLNGPSTLVALPHRGNLGLRRALVIDGNLHLGDLSMARPMPLRLRIVDRAKEPLPRVHVVAEETPERRAYGQTDEGGQVVLGGLGEGPFRFEVRSPREFDAIRVEDYDANLGELVVDGLVEDR